MLSFRDPPPPNLIFGTKKNHEEIDNTNDTSPSACCLSLLCWSSRLMFAFGPISSSSVSESLAELAELSLRSISSRISSFARPSFSSFCCCGVRKKQNHGFTCIGLNKDPWTFPHFTPVCFLISLSGHAYEAALNGVTEMVSSWLLPNPNDQHSRVTTHVSLQDLSPHVSDTQQQERL